MRPASGGGGSGGGTAGRRHAALEAGCDAAACSERIPLFVSVTPGGCSTRQRAGKAPAWSARGACRRQRRSQALRESIEQVQLTAAAMAQGSAFAVEPGGAAGGPPAPAFGNGRDADKQPESPPARGRRQGGRLAAFARRLVRPQAGERFPADASLPRCMQQAQLKHGAKGGCAEAWTAFWDRSHTPPARCPALLHAVGRFGHGCCAAILALLPFAPLPQSPRWT